MQDVAGPPPYPILEYAEYGNLRAFLRHQRNIGSVIQKVEMICISMKFIVEKAIEIAAGMNYLAEQSVVHGDLAARNVLGSFYLFKDEFYSNENKTSWSNKKPHL